MAKGKSYTPEFKEQAVKMVVGLDVRDERGDAENAAVLCSPGWWRPGEQSGSHAGSVDCGAVEYPDGRGGDDYGPAG